MQTVSCSTRPHVGWVGGCVVPRPENVLDEGGRRPEAGSDEGGSSGGWFG